MRRSSATALGGRDFEGRVEHKTNGRSGILIGMAAALRDWFRVGRLAVSTRHADRTGARTLYTTVEDGASPIEYAGDADLADSDTRRHAVVNYTIRSGDMSYESGSLIKTAAPYVTKGGALMVRKRTTPLPTPA